MKKLILLLGTLVAFNAVAQPYPKPGGGGSGTITNLHFETTQFSVVNTNISIKSGVLVTNMVAQGTTIFNSGDGIQVGGIGGATFGASAFNLLIPANFDNGVSVVGSGGAGNVVFDITNNIIHLNRWSIDSDSGFINNIHVSTGTFDGVDAGDIQVSGTLDVTNQATFHGTTNYFAGDVRIAGNAYSKSLYAGLNQSDSGNILNFNDSIGFVSAAGFDGSSTNNTIDIYNSGVGTAVIKDNSQESHLSLRDILYTIVFADDTFHNTYDCASACLLWWYSPGQSVSNTVFQFEASGLGLVTDTTTNVNISLGQASLGTFYMHEIGNLTITQGAGSFYGGTFTSDDAELFDGLTIAVPEGEMWWGYDPATIFKVADDGQISQAVFSGIPTGNGSGFTNLVMNLNTTNTAPVNAVIIRAWVDVTVNGQVFKMPLYQ